MRNPDDGPKYDAADFIRYFPKDKQDGIKKAGEMGGLSPAATMAFVLAGEALRDYCPTEERAKVAGILMVMYAPKAKP